MTHEYICLLTAELSKYAPGESPDVPPVHGGVPQSTQHQQGANVLAKSGWRLHTVSFDQQGRPSYWVFERQAPSG